MAYICLRRRPAAPFFPTFQIGVNSDANAPVGAHERAMPMNKRDIPTEEISTVLNDSSVSGRRESQVGRTGSPDSICVSSLWRTMRAEQFGAQEFGNIQRLLVRIELFGHRNWQSAVDGDVPAAIAVALSFLPVTQLTLQFDIAMTALIKLAIGGDPAAAIVASNILRNLPGSHPLHRQIATSWFVSNLAAAIDRTPNPRSPPKEQHPKTTTNGARTLAQRRTHRRRVLQFLTDQENMP
jgi:hypothetical protein